MEHRASSALSRRLDRASESVLLDLLARIGRRTNLFAHLRALGETSVETLVIHSGFEKDALDAWLCAMAALGVLDYDGAKRTFVLPSSHYDALTAHSSSELGSLEPAILSRLRGTLRPMRRPLSDRADADEKARAIVALVASDSELATLLAARVSVRVLGHGSASLAPHLAERFPRARVATRGRGHDLAIACVVPDRRSVARAAYAIAPDGLYLAPDATPAAHLGDEIGRPLAAARYLLGAFATRDDDAYLASGLTRVRALETDVDPLHRYWLARLTG